MSVSVWCEFICDNCNEAAFGRSVSGRVIPKREMQREAERKGFQFTRDKVYCSRHCRDKADVR